MRREGMRREGMVARKDREGSGHGESSNADIQT